MLWYILAVKHRYSLSSNRCYVVMGASTPLRGIWMLIFVWAKIHSNVSLLRIPGNAISSTFAESFLSGKTTLTVSACYLCYFRILHPKSIFFLEIWGTRHRSFMLLVSINWIEKLPMISYSSRHHNNKFFTHKYFAQFSITRFISRRLRSHQSLK